LKPWLKYFKLTVVLDQSSLLIRRKFNKMAEYKEYNNLGRELEKLLILRTSPLAVKMLEKKEDIPEGSIRPARDRNCHIAQCQAFALSRRERESITMLKEDSWCWAPLVAYGLVDWRPCADIILPKGQAELMPRFQEGKYIGIVSAPLKTADFEPDVVLVYSNTTQLRNMLQVVKERERSLVTSEFDPIDSCVYSVVPVILNGQFRITLPDPGECKRALAGEDEIIFSIPRDKIEMIVNGLQQAEEKKRGYTNPGMEMRPDFPQPEFYKRLFKDWGLS
jgi:uncharacterized protein (DUF169 family)